MQVDQSRRNLTMCIQYSAYCTCIDPFFFSTFCVHNAGWICSAADWLSLYSHRRCVTSLSRTSFIGMFVVLIVVRLNSNQTNFSRQHHHTARINRKEMHPLVASNGIEQCRIKFTCTSHINTADSLNLSVYCFKQPCSVFYRLPLVYRIK